MISEISDRVKTFSTCYSDIFSVTPISRSSILCDVQRKTRVSIPVKSATPSWGVKVGKKP